MSVQNPAYKIKKWSVAGMEAMYCKMFDPPTASPETKDRVPATNPVPEVMAAAELQNTPATPHTVELDLMHGVDIPSWDNRAEGLAFMLIRDGKNPAANGTFPGPTLRIPRGVIFHAHTKGHGPPPHTIHWHGIEPTPMNDGVGHCSMEIGDYTYQFQPSFIGSYFYHCHRNTVQHFEFGLYGFMIVEPPDAFFATQKLGLPPGFCRDGKRRTAANLQKVADRNGNIVDMSPAFPGFNGNDIRTPDPENPTPALADPRNLKFHTDPHAMTVPYDKEVLWVFDDRASAWSDLAKDPHATYPRHGKIPGLDDQFQRNPGKDGFLAFNDFHADYWFVTGVPVPAPKGSTGFIPTGVTIPKELNSGVEGTQVPIHAALGETILLRCLNGAYNCTTITFPENVDVIVIAWDGRALGVPPYGKYNHAYTIKGGTPIHISVARRYDAIIRSEVPIDDFATVEFIDSRRDPDGPEPVLFTAKIPINIGTTPAPPPVAAVSGKIEDEKGATVPQLTVEIAPMSLGGSTVVVQTGDDGAFNVPDLPFGMYQVTPIQQGMTFNPPFVNISVSGTDVVLPAFDWALTLTGVNLSASKPGSQPVDGGPVTFTATAQGVGPLHYDFKMKAVDAADWTDVQVIENNTGTASWTWSVAGFAPGEYQVKVGVRPVGAPESVEQATTINYTLTAAASAELLLVATPALESAAGGIVTFTAVKGGGPYRYEFRVGGKKVQDSEAGAYTWDTSGVKAKKFNVMVKVRGLDSEKVIDKTVMTYTLTTAAPGSATLTATPVSPQAPGTQVVFTAAGQGGSGYYEYEFLFYRNAAGKNRKRVQKFSSTPAWTWDTTGAVEGEYKVVVKVRGAGSRSPKGSTSAELVYTIGQPAEAVTPSPGHQH